MSEQNPNSTAKSNQILLNLQQLQASRDQLNKIEQESLERQTQHENTSLQKDIRNLKEQISEQETKRSEQEKILEDAKRTQASLSSSNLTPPGSEDEIRKKIQNTTQIDGVTMSEGLLVYDFISINQDNLNLVNKIFNETKNSSSGNSENIKLLSEHPDFNKLPENIQNIYKGLPINIDLQLLRNIKAAKENKIKLEEAKKKRQEAETELNNLTQNINRSTAQVNQKEIEAAPSQSVLNNYLKNNNAEAENLKKNIGRLEIVLKQTGNELAKENIERYNNYNTSLINKLNEQTNKKMPESERRKNYITVNRFYIEIESEVRASFTECSGLGVNLKKETYLEGGVNHQQRILLGHAEFTDVTLKRGMTDDLVFWGWISSALTGRPSSRRNVNILLFNQAGETMMCWTLIGAIPISWKAPGFQADGNSVAIEELTLAYEGLQVKTAQGSGGATVGIGRDGLGFFPSN